MSVTLPDQANQACVQEFMIFLAVGVTDHASITSLELSWKYKTGSPKQKLWLYSKDFQIVGSVSNISWSRSRRSRPVQWKYLSVQHNKNIVLRNLGNLGRNIITRRLWCRSFRNITTFFGLEKGGRLPARTEGCNSRDEAEYANPDLPWNLVSAQKWIRSSYFIFKETFLQRPIEKLI